MSNQKAEIEVHRKVYWDGTAITIGPDPEGTGCIRFHTATKDAVEAREQVRKAYHEHFRKHPSHGPVDY